MRNLVIALLLAVIWTPAAQAEITIEDGGFRISVSYGDRFASVSKDNFKVTGTESDAEEAVAIADKKAVERHADFSKSMDLLIGGEFAKPRIIEVEKEVPVYVDRHHHHYTPVPATAPALLPCPLPAGVVLDSWIYPYRRFRCSLGYTWYYDYAAVRWVRSYY